MFSAFSNPSLNQCSSYCNTTYVDNIELVKFSALGTTQMIASAYFFKQSQKDLSLIIDETKQLPFFSRLQTRVVKIKNSKIAHFMAASTLFFLSSYVSLSHLYFRAIK